MQLQVFKINFIFLNIFHFLNNYFSFFYLGIFGISMNIMLKLTQMVIQEPRMLINGIFGSIFLLGTNFLINWIGFI
jgi:hypothetical protein